MKKILTIVALVGGAIEWIGVVGFFVGHFLIPELRNLWQLIPIGGFPAVVASLLQSQRGPNNS